MPSVCVGDINAYVQRCDRQKYQKICLSLHKPEYLEVTWTKTRFGKRVDMVLFTREVWRLVLSQEFLNGEPQLSGRPGLKERNPRSARVLVQIPHFYWNYTAWIGSLMVK